jgi:alkyl hydroperoxide reductase subunit AhpC
MTEETICARVQHRAPNFEAEAVVSGGSFQTVKLHELRGSYIVLFFYPMVNLFNFNY